MPTLRQLRYLVALSNELHFRRAAERVNVTQPTLSVQLQELEKRLKASLIERGGSSVALTPLGREVVERAQTVLSGVDDIIALAAASEHGFHGTIRLGVPPTLGPYFLPHIVAELHANYPQLKLYVKEGKPRDLQLQLAEGVHDAIISPLPVEHSELKVTQIFREQLLVVTAPDHPFAKRGAIKKKDLADEKVLVIERGHHLHDQVIQLCETFGAIPLRDYEGTSLDTMRLMVGMGVGIALMPALYVRSEIGTRGEIAVIKLETANLYRQIGMVWRETSPHSDFFESLITIAKNTAGRLLNDIQTP